MTAKVFLFYKGSPEATIPRAVNTEVQGWYGPTNSHAGRPSQQRVPQGAPGSNSRNTASGYTHTWPPASLSRKPTTARTLVPARSVKSTPSGFLEGPRSRGCAAGQHTQHFGLFVPRCRYSPTNLSMPPQDIAGISTGSRTQLWLPTARCAPGTPVSSGSS